MTRSKRLAVTVYAVATLLLIAATVALIITDKVLS